MTPMQYIVVLVGEGDSPLTTYYGPFESGDDALKCAQSVSGEGKGTATSYPLTPPPVW